MRVIGKRTQLPYGLEHPTKKEREWLISLSKFRTRVPKGIFRYKNHEEANKDWDRWIVEKLKDGLHE